MDPWGNLYRIDLFHMREEHSQGKSRRCSKEKSVRYTPGRNVAFFSFFPLILDFTIFIATVYQIIHV